jgi:hypothetical protein
MRSNFALGCLANCVLAWFAQSGKPPFDAQQDAAGAWPDGGTLLPNISPTSVPDGDDFHERSLAGFTEVLEMCLNAFGERI